MPLRRAITSSLLAPSLLALAAVMLLAADVPGHMEIVPGGNVSLSGDDDATLSGYYDGLSAGGVIPMPFAVAPWGDKFGMFTDTFGTSWMVNVTMPKG